MPTARAGIDLEAWLAAVSDSASAKAQTEPESRRDWSCMLTGGGSGGRGIAIYYSMHETFAKHVFWSWRCQRPSWLLGKLHPSAFFQCRTHTCVNLQLEPNLWIRLLGWVAWGSCRQVAHFCIGWMDGWHSGAAMQDEDDPHPVADQTLL